MKNNILVVGLTGQTGAGKSTVAEIFAERAFQVINADQVSRQVVAPGEPCLEKLVDCFGAGILNPDGSLDRKALAEIVFTDQEQLNLLNRTIHPFIIQEIQKQIQEHAVAGQSYILLDAPTLFESKADRLCSRIISVIADQEIRCERIMQRDHLTRQSALERINSQLEEDYFISHSDDILENNADQRELAEKSRELAELIKLEYNFRNFLKRGF